MSGPDLHVFTLKFLALKNFKLFFVHKNLKERASKVAHNWPKPFYFTFHSPKLIFHIMKSRDQTSVLLSVVKNIQTASYNGARTV